MYFQFILGEMMRKREKKSIRSNQIENYLSFITLTVLCFLLPMELHAQGSSFGPVPLSKHEVTAIVLDNYYPNRGKWTVLDSTVVINNHSYKCILGQSAATHASRISMYCRLREDGFYVFNTGVTGDSLKDERLYYKKNAMIGNSWSQYAGLKKFYWMVTDTGYRYFYGKSRPVKKVFITDSTLTYEYQYWSEEFGMVYDDGGGEFRIDLIGSVIDGVVYGDTSCYPTGVEYNNEPVKTYSLSQNYPNPFNPSTVISFTVPRSGHVTLVIYDLLGKEIERLIDEEKPPGSYNVSFNASRLSSGVYLYKLECNDFRDMKKMIVLK